MTDPSTPQCRMCSRDARQGWPYCSGGSCTNPVRTCQRCTEEFRVRHEGAGHKYCASCTQRGAGAGNGANVRHCAWCAKPAPPGPGGRAPGVWPYVCSGCIDPIRHIVGRLKAHHVSIERARALLSDPGCECCGVDLVEKVRDKSTGRIRALLVVDHDHWCCPGQFSCGRCVRGLICNLCNTAAGMLRNDPDVALSMAKYLERHRGSGG